MTDEAIRIFLARDLRVADPTGFIREAEEADLEPRWVPLADALAMVESGAITNAMCVLGVLAAARAAETDFATLRAATSLWPDRPGHSG
jgi:ADP-ribose pyrophosphatase